jgi:HAD superfamily hydrolase (TIGR01509 family)
MIMLAILFDCDGVLVDSEKLSCSSWLPVLARQGIRAELEEIEQFVGKSDRAVLSYFRARTGRKLNEELIAEREAEYFRLGRGKLKSFPGSRKLLEALERRNVAVAVVSSGRPERIRFNLQQAGLADRFNVVCSVTEVARGKPAPDLFLLGASRLGVKPERCIVVEDSVFGIQAARAANMFALGFASSYSPTELVAAGANQVIMHYAELLPIVDRWYETFALDQVQG